MKCLSPRFSSQRHSYVPCGQCYFCRTRKRYEWTCRVLMERLSFDNGFFITLTYNDDNLPSDHGVSYEHARKFTDRLNRWFKDHVLPHSFYLMSEYGGRTQRPHYHMHFFTDLSLLEFDVLVKRYWPYGFVKYGRTTLKSVLYTSSFHLLPKEHVNKYPQPNFHIISRGLGKSFADEYASYYVSHNRKVFEFAGWKFNLPPYIKKRMGFTDSQDLRSLNLFEVKNQFYLKCIENGFTSGIYHQWENYVNNLNNKLLIKGLKSKIC